MTVTEFNEKTQRWQNGYVAAWHYRVSTRTLITPGVDKYFSHSMAKAGVFHT